MPEPTGALSATTVAVVVKVCPTAGLVGVVVTVMLVVTWFGYVGQSAGGAAFALVTARGETVNRAPTKPAATVLAMVWLRMSEPPDIWEGCAACAGPPRHETGPNQLPVGRHVDPVDNSSPATVPVQPGATSEPLDDVRTVPAVAPRPLIQVDPINVDAPLPEGSDKCTGPTIQLAHTGYMHLVISGIGLVMPVALRLGALRLRTSRGSPPPAGRRRAARRRPSVVRRPRRPRTPR